LAQYSDLFTVDFSQESRSEFLPSFFAAQISFTYLDWFILERVLKERDFDLSNIDEET